MPPKRKRAEQATTATTRTRTSTRKMTPASTEGDASGSAEPIAETPAAKKTKRAPAKTSRGRATRSQVQEPSSDEPSPSLAKASNEISASASSANDTVKAKPAKSSRPTEADPFSPERATELFNKYTEPDDTSVIGVDGFLKLCNDAGIAMDGPLPILLHWQLNAEDMMKIKKSEWDEGMAGLQIASLPTLSIALHDLEDLLILDHPPLKPPAGVSPTPRKRNAASSSEPYNRSRYYAYAADLKSFDDLYKYCFSLPKTDKRVRNIEMDTATAFWSVLLLPRYPLMQDILDFINEKKDTYKGVNKDLWLMVLEFCRTISPTLQDYDTDGAWPTMLDDFVTWKRSQVSGNGKAFVQA